MPKSYDVCEAFCFDLRLTTGIQVGPLFESGHRVSLRLE